MHDELSWLGALCTSATTWHGSLLLGLFAAGVAGSVVHCGPMCGAFVLGQMSERMARLPPEQLCELRRIGNGMLLPYHLGRLTTYAGLGAASATALAQLPWFTRLSAMLLMIAALLFLTHAIGRIGRVDRAPRAWGRAIGLVTRRIPRGTLLGEYFFGVALGFLPCGLLYAAVATATASGNPFIGAAAMVAFGLGTAPILMLIGIGGYAGGRRWSHGMTTVAPALMVLNAVLLVALAWQRLT